LPGKSPFTHSSPAGLSRLLVTLDRRYTAEQPADPWPAFSAREIQAHFAR